MPDKSRASIFRFEPERRLGPHSRDRATSKLVSSNAEVARASGFELAPHIENDRAPSRRAQLQPYGAQRDTNQDEENIFPGSPACQLVKEKE